MPQDDSEVDDSVDASDVTDPETAPQPDASVDSADRPGTSSGSQRSLPERLSETVASRRSYGMERVATPETTSGLLTVRERQYLRHAHRLDDADRSAVEEVLTDRVAEFVDSDWPVIREEYPDVAAAIREELCGESD